MAVKISNLWSNNRFLNLTNNSKLLYIYLSTHPSIMNVGVLSLNLELVQLQLGLSLQDIRFASTELTSCQWISIKKFDGELFFIVKAHFDSVPKSDTSILRIKKDLTSLPSKLVDYLSTIGIDPSQKVVKFIEPTSEEVMEYALSQNHQIDAQKFISYYRDKGKEFGKEGQWVNWKGKPIRDWKATMRNVWFKDENKLKVIDGAPKGFESFYIDFEGKQVFPESWKNGKPHSRNIAVTKALQREYDKRRTKNS